MALKGSRKVLLGGSFLVTVVAGLAIAAMVNWLGYRHWRRFDWTRSKVYSISETTRKILGKLDKPLRVIVFLPADGQQRSGVYDEVKELADRYAAASPQVKVEYVDPFRNRIRGQEIAQKYGLERASSIVFEYGEGDGVRRHLVEESRLADWDYTGLAYGERPKMEAFKGEEVFTAAIKGLIERKLRVVFTAGHGEPSFKGAGDSDWATAAEALRRENFEVEEWTGLSADKVPDGTDILVIAGPKKPLLPNELTAVRAYLDGGGKLLLLLDPVFGADRQSIVRSGLESLVAEWGVRADDDIVVDPASALPMFGADTIYTNRFRPHPVTRGLEAFPMIMPLARSIAATTAPSGYEAQVLVETSPEGWGETDLSALPRVAKGEKDVPGPVPLAVAVGPRAKSVGEQMEDKVPGAAKTDDAPRSGGGKTRLVVFGDSEFGSNVLFERNAPHFLAAVNWLAVREESLGIPPKRSGKVALQLNPDQLFRIDLIIFLLLPGLAVAAGLAVWWRRRN